MSQFDGKIKKISTISTTNQSETSKFNYKSDQITKLTRSKLQKSNCDKVKDQASNSNKCKLQNPMDSDGGGDGVEEIDEIEFEKSLKTNKEDEDEVVNDDEVDELDNSELGGSEDEDDTMRKIGKCQKLSSQESAPIKEPPKKRKETSANVVPKESNLSEDRTKVATKCDHLSTWAASIEHGLATINELPAFPMFANKKKQKLIDRDDSTQALFDYVTEQAETQVVSTSGTSKTSKASEKTGSSNPIEPSNEEV
ncbi:hypothetical protein C1645_827152 [Glomus cerebriforme]|uniref:Uncharacterized protein n=1 Tax=Glomus cerebriforme TaxID=658196 RepID=A0A397SPD4_9GLOM|nr:hypothetical protein C1645_827152 [Glomus cerebriforme]